MAGLMKAIQVARWPTPGQGVALDSTGKLPPTVPVTALRLVTADPVGYRAGEFWYRTDTNALCVAVTTASIKRVTLS